MFKIIFKYIKSLNFTILLISLLGFMFLLGLWIPQKSLVKQWYFQWKSNAPGLVSILDALQLTDIYTSPIMLTLWVFFFINLALVIWHRIPLIKSRIALSEARITDPATAGGGYPFHNSYLLSPEMDYANILGYLRKCGYAVLGNGNGFYAVKNRLSPLAFGFFHLSFFLILLGGLTSFYTQFIGSLELTEGEIFQGEVERYVQRPPPALPKIGTPPNVTFTIKSIVPVVSGFTETGLKVQLADAAGQVHNLDINRPYNTDNTSFVLKNLGPSPLIILKDPSGKEIDGAYIKLDVLKGRKDKFEMGGFEFQVLFYPDYILEKGKATTRTLEFKNPVFAISAGRNGKKAGEGIVTPNGTMKFDGYSLEMKEMPFWVRFSVIKEHGIAIIYSGFALASLAVIWRLLFFKREIVGAIREESAERRLIVAGRSEYYKRLAEDEFEQLFSRMLANRDNKVIS